MNKTASIGIRVEPATKIAAEKAAADDHRTLASLIEKLLVEHLKAKGYLTKIGSPAQRDRFAAHAKNVAAAQIDRALRASAESDAVKGQRRRTLTEMPAGLGKRRRTPSS